tara:strand:+ start:1887 stop:2357 length:471 start_codon:yes stop_codon:yes gene_type:complete
MGFTATGISTTTVTTTQQAPLGFILTVPDGDNGAQEWVYIYNDDAASLVEGTICTRDVLTATYDAIVAPVNAPTIGVMGVAQQTIAAGSYGFILRKGIGEVLADTGGVTAENALVVGNAVPGRADNVGAVTTHAFGYATETKAATLLATCFINCPG